MKNKNKKPTNNPPQKKSITVTAIGHIDIELIFNITDELLAKHKIEWDGIHSATDLQFLQQEGDITNFSSLHSNNNLVNSLIYLNKTSQGGPEKYKIDFITLNEFLKILKKDEEKFLNEIFKNVTEHNNLFIHEKEIIHETKSKLIITVKNNKKIKSFGLKVEIAKNDDDKQNSHALQKMPLEEDILQKINFDYNSTEYLFLDLEDFLSISSENSQNILEHFLKFLEFISSLKEKTKIILSYSNIMNQSKSLNLKTVELIIQIFSISDILIFEKKDVHSLFNLIYQIKESEGVENIKQLPEKDLTEYFSKTINFVRKINKVCLFLDDFQKLTVLEISSKKRKPILERTNDLNLHPKINHTNQKLIEEYKKILSQNYSHFRSIFFGGFLSNFLNNPLTDKKEKLKVYYSSLLAGMEITKKILEFTKNKQDLPLDKDFYLVKISQSKIEREIEKENLKTKEEKFVLDCINQRSSRLKYYHPLYDSHLNFFFSSEMNRKQLKGKGFINTNGFIMYDGLYRDVMGSSPKNNSEGDKKIYGAFKSINAGEDSKDSESLSKIRGSSSPTNRKLPILKFEYLIGGNVNSSNVKGKLKLKPITGRASKSNKENKKREDSNAKADSSKVIDETKESKIDLYSNREDLKDEDVDDQIQEDS